MNDYVPKRGLRNGHLMTVYCWGKRRRFPTLGTPSERYFDVAAGARVLAHCYWQEEHDADDRASPNRATSPPHRTALIALHGLEGSSSAHYMRGLAAKAIARGFNVILLNQRNCGGTESLSEGLYHSGLTADVAHVLAEIAAEGIDRVVVAGYSLGGNLALKLAGDYGDSPPPSLKGVCAVSPVMELAECVRALERRQNFIYQWNFVRLLKARMRRKAAAYPERFPVDRLQHVRTVRDFDEYFTAPHFSFQGASDYYFRASAMRVIDQIRVPGLIITAENDPFVPSAPFGDPRVRANRHLNVIVTKYGGHCGFAADANGKDDGYWAETQIVEFAARVTR